MDWIFNALPFLIFLFVVVSVIRGAAKVVRKMGEQQEATRRPAAFDPGEAQRTRRIQEEIRRKIAERRGLAPPPMEPPLTVEESIEPPSLALSPPPPEAPANASMAAILERQQQLADQMRELEEARVVQQRRAAAVAATKQEESDQSAATGAMRGSLLEDLRKAPTARRAILLREILDRPVGLR